MKFREYCIIDVSFHRCTKPKAYSPFNEWRMALFKRDILVAAKYGGKYRGFKNYFHESINARYYLVC